MDIGTGIALAGIWLFVAVAYQSKNTNTTGSLIALVVGVVMTFAILLISAA